jgi:hypothetical protein
MGVHLNNTSQLLMGGKVIMDTEQFCLQKDKGATYTHTHTNNEDNLSVSYKNTR